MRILYLVGGNDVIAGGATIRDAAFVQGLAEAGHDVIAVSLFGPAGMEGEDGYSQLFKSFGNNTLRRIFPRLSHMPSTLASFVRSPRPAAGSMTSLAVMGKRIDPQGPLAVSLLSGTNKQQRRELSRLMEHVEKYPGPVDAVVLANALLSGMAEPLQNSLGCPIICLSQGSDQVVEALDEPYRSDARKLVRKNARRFSVAVSTSRYFAIRATELMALPASRVAVVSPGVDIHAFSETRTRKRTPFTVGYMAPIRKEKGLDILIDAVDSLFKDTAIQPTLWIAGKVEDERYWSRLGRRLENHHMKHHHKVFGNLGGKERRAFMEGLSAFVVSSREPESRGTSLLEAMAAGVPVIGPAFGIIPEIFQHANGGLLVSSEAPSWMFAQALELLAAMPDTGDELGRTGRTGVREYFSIERAAKSLADIIGRAIESSRLLEHDFSTRRLPPMEKI
jgi:Glycosyltransferase